MAKKLFLGISLDKQQILQVCQLQRNFDPDVKTVPAENLHMTLAFFGIVSGKAQRKLEKRISAISKAKFSVTLDRLAHWKKPRILCLTGLNTDKALLQIVNNCQLLARSFDLQTSEHAFSAHLTLARKAHHLPHVPAAQLIIKPLLLKPDEVHLFESKSIAGGVEYRVLRSWKLQQV